MKTCSKCKVEKPNDDFYRRGTEGNLRSDCKQCLSERSSTRYRTDPAYKARSSKRSRDFQMMKLYGLTPEDYQAMSDKAGGCCELCGTDQCATGYKLAVDHCHATGNVRGLLCQACNTALGSFRDDTDLLTKAINYLKERQ